MMWHVILAVIRGRTPDLRPFFAEVAGWPDHLRGPAEDTLHELRHAADPARRFMLAGRLEALEDARRRLWAARMAAAWTEDAGDAAA